MKHTRPKAEKLEMAMIKSQQNLTGAIFNLFGAKMGAIKHFEGVERNNKEIYAKKTKALKKPLLKPNFKLLV